VWPYRRIDGHTLLSASRTSFRLNLTVASSRYQQIREVWVVKIVRQTLFAGDSLQVGLFNAQPGSEAYVEIVPSAHLVALPVGGLFSQHDAPNRSVIGTPSYAVRFTIDTPYRIGFPGGIGDRALILRLDTALEIDELDKRRRNDLGSCGLLTAEAMILRNLLWAKQHRLNEDELESEAISLDLLRLSLNTMNSHASTGRSSTLARRRSAIERVKEAVGAAPADKWSVTQLAAIANLSPFYLCHVFRQTTGTSIYDYVVQERLAHSLDAVLDGGNLMAIALDAGFSSHSHFTTRFRRFFGITPSVLRDVATTEKVATFCKLVTAPRENSRNF
jgi:AraC family transcriptional regulator